MLAGKQLACPSCGSLLEIPGQREERIVVACRCGQQFQARAALAGKSVPCPACGTSLTIGGGTAQVSAWFPGFPDPFWAGPAAGPTIPASYSPTPTGFPASRPVASESYPTFLIWLVGAGVGVFLLVMGLIAVRVAMNSRPIAVHPTPAADESGDSPRAPAVSSGLPSTPEELERHYRIPAGETDLTEDWRAGLLPFAGTQFTIDSVNVPIVDTEMSNLPFALRIEGVPSRRSRWQLEPNAKAFLNKYRVPLDKLQATAEQYGAARFPTQFRESLTMPLRECDGMRRAMRALELQARVQEREGNSAATARTICTMCRLNQSMTNFPLLVPQLLRSQGVRAVHQTMADLLWFTKFTETELHSLSAHLEGLDFDRGFYEGLVGERVIGLMIFEKPSLFTEMVRDKNSQHLIPPGYSSGLESSLRRRSAAMQERDRAAFEECMALAFEALGQPFPEKWKAVERHRAAVNRMKTADVPERQNYLLTTLYALPLEATVAAHGVANASRDLTIVAIALERYRRDKGAMPEHLQELVPDYLPELPLDPFDGHPFRYRRAGNRYLLYSIGANRRDDQGDAAKDADLVFPGPFVRPAKK